MNIKTFSSFDKLLKVATYILPSIANLKKSLNKEKINFDKYITIEAISFVESL